MQRHYLVCDNVPQKIECVQSPTTNQGLLFASWVIFSCIFQSADFFQNHLFQKTLSGIPSECQAVWMQIRPHILWGLIWVQTVWKCYQQTTSASKQRIRVGVVFRKFPQLYIFYQTYLPHLFR